MGGSVKTVESGGGPAVPLANDFVNVLQNFLRSGKFGVGADNAVGRSMEAFDTLNQLVSGTDISGMGKSIKSIIQGDVTRGAADLRERSPCIILSIGLPFLIYQYQRLVD